MADKTELAKIQIIGEWALHIWSDLSPEQIESVEGVASATLLDTCVSAWLDRRYDGNSVAEEIRALAESQVA